MLNGYFSVTLLPLHFLGSPSLSPYQASHGKNFSKVLSEPGVTAILQLLRCTSSWSSWQPCLYGTGAFVSEQNCLFKSVDVVQPDSSPQKYTWGCFSCPVCPVWSSAGKGCHFAWQTVGQTPTLYFICSFNQHWRPLFWLYRVKIVFCPKVPKTHSGKREQKYYISCVCK